jgi:hypothetical protein
VVSLKRNTDCHDSINSSSFDAFLLIRAGDWLKSRRTEEIGGMNESFGHPRDERPKKLCCCSTKYEGASEVHFEAMSFRGRTANLRELSD